MSNNGKLKPYEKLINYVKTAPKKGTVISHTTIEQIMGVPYRKSCNCLNHHYRYNVSRANDYLTSLSLRLESIQGFGYRIIEDKDYVKHMRKFYNTGVTYIQKAKTIADCTDLNSLSNKDYTEWAKIYGKIKNAQSKLSKI